MRYLRISKWLILALALAGVSTGCTLFNFSRTMTPREFEFVVTSDMREFTPPQYSGTEYFRGACEAIRDVGAGAFMICPGDIDPPDRVRATLDTVFGINYPWYPVVGNHEAETPSDMEWLRAWASNDIPGLVRRGPPGAETTTFSFDHGKFHFVVLNQYYNGQKDTGSKGDVVDELYEWLKSDLRSNRRREVIVIGHEPILPTPDMDNGRLRHETDSLNAYPENSRRFHELMLQHKVKVYLCAHTHNASIVDLEGVWQIDSGHARGKGDLGAPSTFVRFLVKGRKCTVEFYRQSEINGPYRRTKVVPL